MTVFAYKKLSPHFNLHEFTVSRTAAVLGIDNTPSIEVLGNLKFLATKMEVIRKILRNNPIIITSGYRSPRLNAAVPGSSPTSHHTTGWAVDFVCPGFGSPVAIARRLEEAGNAVFPELFTRFDQLIYEYDWVHLSFYPLLRGHVMTIRSGQPAQMGIVEKA